MRAYELQVVTARGAIRSRPNPAAAALAYEVLSAPPRLWHHGVLFSLPDAAAAVPARRAITELGPGPRCGPRERPRARRSSISASASAAFAFCVRTADPVCSPRRCVARRASRCSRRGAMLAGALVAASPHRVAFSRLARIEVYQPIAPEGGATPSGPHTHVLPRLLRPQVSRTRRTSGCPRVGARVSRSTRRTPRRTRRACAKPFSHAEHAAFQSLFAPLRRSRGAARRKRP